MKKLNIHNRLFIILAAVAALFATGFFIRMLLPLVWGLLMATVVMLLVDITLLFTLRKPFEVARLSEKMLSLSDENTIRITIRNLSSRKRYILLLDELPEQLQIRDFSLRTSLNGHETKELSYSIRPRERGEYHFGKLILFSGSRLRLAERYLVYPLDQTLPVYPSLIQMRKFDLRSMEHLSASYGMKRIRKIGHSYEFETIKDYVTGDDIRSINWKATSRFRKLMVNQYEDERSQQVYAVIDKSRPMMMSSGGVCLLDYAINTALVIANIALQKQDKAGIVTFSDRMGSMIKAGNGKAQLRQILETLYKEKGRTTEADYELLYQALNRLIPVRSLVILFTNFETMYSLERVIHILRKISQRHLLLVVNFRNEALRNLVLEPSQSVGEIYTRILAEEMIAEKEQMAAILRHHHIQTILSGSDDLTVNSVNKYLELKARGMI
jgi:uncharacterized protein (DUF58 family)